MTHDFRVAILETVRPDILGYGRPSPVTVELAQEGYIEYNPIDPMDASLSGLPENYWHAELTPKGAAYVKQYSKLYNGSEAQ